MPAHTVGDQRWVHVGENSAGDRMFGRATTQVSGGYEDMTKDELAAELESRGLAKSGTKAEQIARLQEDDG